VNAPVPPSVAATAAMTTIPLLLSFQDKAGPLLAPHR